MEAIPEHRLVGFRPERQPVKEKLRRMVVKSDYEPAGDQPTAITTLVQGVADGEVDQVLLGVTGSGKTFTMRRSSKRPRSRP